MYMPKGTPRDAVKKRRRTAAERGHKMTYLNRQQVEAQEKFNTLYNRFLQGHMDGEQMLDMVRNGLTASGFDLTSREAIDGFENEIVGPIYEQKQAEEKRLCGEVWNILISAGATEMQLMWGNSSQARLTRKQEKKIQKLSDRIDRVRGELLISMTFAAVLNEARAALG